MTPDDALALLKSGALNDAATALRRTYQFLLGLDSDQAERRQTALDLLESLDIDAAVFLLSGVRDAAITVTGMLPGELRAAAEERNAARARGTLLFDGPGVDDTLLLVQLRGQTTQWAALALDHAAQVWPDRQQRAEYFEQMARSAYEAGDVHSEA